MSDAGVAKRFAHRLEYAGLYVAGALFRMAPDGWVYAIARALATVAFDALRIRRDVTLSNLRLAFGESKSEREIVKIAREAYRNIGVTFIEMLFVGSMKGRIAGMVDVSETAMIREGLEKGRGAIIVSGHFGSWELNGASLVLSGIPMTVVAKKQSNPYVDRFIDDARKSFGMKVINPGASIKHIVRALKKGEAIGLISDQDAGRSGVFVDFFGRKASTPGGAAQLAMKFGSPLYVSMTKRTGNGRYSSLVREIAVLADDTVESLTQRFTATIEGIIEEYPEQYFWMHRRWKTRPPGEPDVKAAGDSHAGGV
ncbi:MAG: lysophospholipid acyltransferase family protein [Candidatus Latescibacteria bacterium]|nr:lysophospholipid acyltransferase family protein [Candidatus Latescibacterota bacterium]